MTGPDAAKGAFRDAHCREGALRGMGGGVRGGVDQFRWEVIVDA